MHQSVTVRTAVEVDVADVVALWDGEGMIRSPEGGAQELRAFLATVPAACLVAVDGAGRGRVVGAVVASVTAHRAMVHHLAVAPNHRRHGIGDALMDELGRRVRELGATRVGVLVFGDNESGRAFWARRGFTDAPDVVYATLHLGAVSQSPDPGRDPSC